MYNLIALIVLLIPDTLWLVLVARRRVDDLQMYEGTDRCPCV